MPFLYVYSPSDFVSGLPDESDASAAGSPTFSITLAVGATPTLIEITDNDLIFDEVDGSQNLTNGVNIDGATYGAGTTINTAYDLINTTTGHKLTSFHFGGDGYQQGAVDGVASTVPLTPGVTYTFDTERTSHLQANAYTDYTACFTSDTLIETVHGPTPVQDLQSGDLITTETGCAQLRLKLYRDVTSTELLGRPNLRPIQICAGALGNGLPLRDLVVSPQHRMLVSSPIVERMFGVSSVLIAATKLTVLPGIFIKPVEASVTYHHLVLDQHDVIFAEGAATESFYPGKTYVNAMTPAAREELQCLFPEIGNADFTPLAAKTIPIGRRQRKLIDRHLKNGQALMQSTSMLPLAMGKRVA